MLVHSLMPHSSPSNSILQLAKTIIVLEDVPAEVCDTCGEKYFTPDVSRKIELKVSEILTDGKAERQMSVPVASLVG